MTTDPPPSSEGSALPPRHRPHLGNLARETTEQDLWALDDDGPAVEELPEAVVKPDTVSIPQPRDSEKARRLHLKDAPHHGTGKDQIKLNYGKANPSSHAGPSFTPPKPGGEFDELEQWDDSEAAAPLVFQKIESVPVEPAPAAAVVLQPAPVVPEDDDQDVFSPPRREISEPVPPRPQWRLSMTERIGLVALAAILVTVGVFGYIHSIGGLPRGDSFARRPDFPVRGKYLTLESGDSYWRIPGESDKVRRDTQLVPVVEFTASSGPAAIRVFFRDSEGILVGDPVSHAVQAGGKFQVVASAGFDDVGMHAAYRTGKDKPWTIEVLEGPSEDSPTAAFIKLFDMNLSPARR